MASVFTSKNTNLMVGVDTSKTCLSNTLSMLPLVGNDGVIPNESIYNRAAVKQPTI